MFKISNLTAKVDNKKILSSLDLQINDGEIHVIMGKNGIGKSSLCKIIMRDNKYEVLNGNITYNGKDILKMGTNEVANTGIFYLSQNPIFIEGVTNAEMLRSSLREKSSENIDIFKFNKDLEDACDKLALDHKFIHKDINVGASGGEKKKVELLHASILKPSFLILDELDSGLDVEALKVCCDFINEYHKTTGCSILIITHHSNIVDYIKPNYVHVLSDGKIIKTSDYKLAYEIEKNGFIGANQLSEVGKNE